MAFALFSSHVSFSFIFDGFVSLSKFMVFFISGPTTSLATESAFDEENRRKADKTLKNINCIFVDARW